jgi:hypothetical protein
MDLLRWTIPGPLSSYSCLEIHMFWKVDKEAMGGVDQNTSRKEMRIHTKNATADPDRVLPLGRSDDLDLKEGIS